MEKGLWSCPQCGRVFFFKFDLDSHLKEAHENLFNQFNPFNPSRRKQK